MPETTQEKYERLAAMGHSQVSAAALCGVSRNTISKIAKRHGIKFANGRVDAERDARIIAMRKNGMTQAQIAAEIGIRQTGVSTILRRLGMGGRL